MRLKIFLFSGFMVLTTNSFCQLTVNPEKQEIISDDTVFAKVEKEASFPGGLPAFRKFLETHLNPLVPVDNNAKTGTYTVMIRFIVSRDSSISNITAETNFGHGMEEEAIRMIKRSANWIPAMQNGKAVNAYKRQPITFVVSNE